MHLLKDVEYPERGRQMALEQADPADKLHEQDYQRDNTKSPIKTILKGYIKRTNVDIKACIYTYLKSHVRLTDKRFNKSSVKRVRRRDNLT